MARMSITVGLRLLACVSPAAALQHTTYSLESGANHPGNGLVAPLETDDGTYADFERSMDDWQSDAALQDATEASELPNVDSPDAFARALLGRMAPDVESSSEAPAMEEALDAESTVFDTYSLADTLKSLGEPTDSEFDSMSNNTVGEAVGEPAESKLDAMIDNIEAVVAELPETESHSISDNFEPVHAAVDADKGEEAVEEPTESKLDSMSDNVEAVDAELTESTPDSSSENLEPVDAAVDADNVKEAVAEPAESKLHSMSDSAEAVDAELTESKSDSTSDNFQPVDAAVESEDTDSPKIDMIAPVNNHDGELVKPALVSVIVPTCNRNAFLSSALEQIALQDYPLIEVVVVDDGDEDAEDVFPPSSHRTMDDDGFVSVQYPRKESASDMTVRLVTLSSSTSIGAKRNTAVRASRGDVIVHWDDDDMFPPNRISSQVLPLKEGLARMTVLEHKYFFEESRQIFLEHNELVRAPDGSVTRYNDFFSKGHGALFLGTLAYVRDVWDAVGGYEKVSKGEDIRFIETALQRCEPLLNVRGVPNVYVRHNNTNLGAHNTWTFNKLEQHLMYDHVHEVERPSFVSEEMLAQSVAAERGADKQNSCAAPSEPAAQFAIKYFPEMPLRCCSGGPRVGLGLGCEKQASGESVTNMRVEGPRASQDLSSRVMEPPDNSDQQLAAPHVEEVVSGSDSSDDAPAEDSDPPDETRDMPSEAGNHAPVDDGSNEVSMQGDEHEADVRDIVVGQVGNAESAFSEADGSDSPHKDWMEDAVAQEVAHEDMQSELNNVDPFLVSVIMPTCNRNSFLSLALQQIESQDYPLVEAVVVDDGNTPWTVFPDHNRSMNEDGTVILQYNRRGSLSSKMMTVRLVRLDTPTSIGEKRNMALRAAQGDIIMHWDDDDMFPENRVSEQVLPLLRGKARMVVLEHDLFFDEAMQVFLQHDKKVDFFSSGDVVRYNDFFSKGHGALFLGTLTYFRDVWDEVGGYEDVSQGEDIRFIEAALKNCVPLLNVGGVHNVYVRHSNTARGARNTWMFSEHEQDLFYDHVREVKRPEFVSDTMLAKAVAAEREADERGRCSAPTEVPVKFAVQYFPEMPFRCCDGVMRDGQGLGCEKSPPHPAGPPDAPAETNDLSESGYRAVQALHSNGKMGRFVRKYLESRGAAVSNYTAFVDFIPECSGAKGSKDFARLVAELQVAPFVMWDASVFSEAGYQEVAALRLNGKMGAYIRKLLATKGAKVIDDAAFKAFVPQFSGVKATQTYRRLVDSLNSAPFIEMVQESPEEMTGEKAQTAHN